MTRHSAPRGASAPGARAGSRPIPISVQPVRTGDIGDYLEALGTVTPLRTVTVLSRVQGQITQIHYREGQLVKRGDPLIDIDARPYRAALLQAEGAEKRDEALLAEARIDLVRYRRAYAHRAIPKQQLDDQEQVVHQDAGAVLADQGTVDAARANLDYCHITSPADGRVGLRLLDTGNIVQANSATPLVVVTQIRPISVVFNVAEDFVPEVEEGIRQSGEAPMEVDAFDRTGQKKLATGTFLTTDNQIDTTTGTVRVRAVFDNEDGALFPLQFVNARLLVRTEHNATLIAAPAVQRGAEGTFVYVIDADQKTAHMRAVKVGTTEAGVTAVEGVQAGESVAVAGFDKLEDGVKVSIAPPAPAAHQLAGSVPTPRPRAEPRAKVPTP